MSARDQFKTEKTRKLAIILPLSVLLLFMWGCVSPITMNRIQFVELGMSSNQLSSMVGQKPTKVFTVVDREGGLDYQVQIFPMQTGIATTDFVIYSEGTYVPVWVDNLVAEDFAFLFREGSLLFWGFLHEYARSDDKLFRRLAPIIMEGLEKEKGNETD